MDKKLLPLVKNVQLVHLQVIRSASIASFVALCCLLLPVVVNAQSNSGSPASIIDRIIDKFSSKKSLFENDEVLSIRLSGDIRQLFMDKSEKPKSHPLVLSYLSEGGDEIRLPIKARTRGHFRKSMGNCTYPPILLTFPKNDTLSSSIFKDQDKLKLVMPCCGDDYVVREWLVYKLYNLVTPKSFRARLVKVELDMAKRKKPAAFYGILLEEEKQMAKRNKMVTINRRMNPEQLDVQAFLRMAVFEYLIGNTDWSVQYQQNIKLIAKDSTAKVVPVPYDFDHAGMINTPYAKPAEELMMHSVRQRRYRGYCVGEMKYFDDAIEFYNKLKKDIYSVYTNCSLLNEKYIKLATQYLDQFYNTINNPNVVQKEFNYPCDKHGTGNVVIKGLRKVN
jgi:hypothetical protein